MTNINRAEVILTDRYHKDEMEGDGAASCFDAAAAADALADAGLLTPDPTYRSAPLVGMTWDEEDGVPDGYVHLTFRVPETGRGFSAKDTATINLAGTDHAEGGAS